VVNLRRWWLSVLLVCWVGCGDDKGTPPDTTPPSAVGDLRVAGTALDGVTLSWTATGDDAGFGQAARYEVRYGAALFAASDWDSATVAPSPPTPKVGGGAEVFAISNLPVGVWRFGVKVLDEASNVSPISNIVAATVIGDPPPAQITDLAVVSDDGDSVTLSWTAPGADGNAGTASVYDLRHASTTLTEATWGDAVAIQGVPAPRVAGSVETFTVEGLEVGVEHFFALKAADGTPTYSPLSNVVSVTLESDTPPGRVTDLAVTSGNDTSVTLSWTAPGADGDSGRAAEYDLRYAIGALTEETWAAATRVKGVPPPEPAGTTETLTISGLESNETYAFGLKTSDDTPLLSELSNVAVASTASLVQLTHSSSPSGAYDPAWSPDGRQIAFEADWAGPRGYSELYLIPASGGEAVQLTNEVDAALAPAWSPDGAQIAYVARRNNVRELWAIAPVPGSKPTLLVREDGRDISGCAWSPHGNRLAYVVLVSQFPFVSEIYTVDTVGGSPELLARGGTENGSPDWSPDGTQIAFNSDRGGSSDIWVVDATGGEPIQLTNDPAYETTPAWSPDGAEIAFASFASGNSDIWLISMSGTAAVQVTSEPTDEYGPSWSPDGSRITFVAVTSAFIGDIWTVRLK